MKKGVNIIFIIILVALIGGLGFFSYKLIFQEEKILVPDFADKSRDEILTWCNSLEVNPCSFDNDYSDTVEKDKLIYQSISADQELGDSISFIISLGKKIEIKTPKLDDQTTKETIENWIKENNITNKVEYIEQYDNEIAKSVVIKIEPTTITSSTDAIKVYISKGIDTSKKDETKDGIEVEYGEYIDLSEEEFIKKAKELGLTANHKEEKDAYSSDVEEGNIVWHGSGTYDKNETFNYGLSLGVGEAIVIKKGDYVGKTLDEFKKICEELGLTPEHSETFSDDYSDTIAKGSIDWHGEGTYVKNEVIHYTLSLGKKSDADEDYTLPKDITKYDYAGKSLDEFKTIASKFGFTANYNSNWDDYSDTIPKGYILRNGEGHYTKDDTYISYGLSLGKKNSSSSEFEIKSGQYVGKTLDEFKKAVTELGLIPEHSVANSDNYSDTVEKGCILWHGAAADFRSGETIHYTVSLGKKSESQTTKVNVVSYAGKSEDEFKSYLTSNNLKVGTRSTSYSDTVASGLIISNDTGSKDEGSYINYTVSLGVKTEDTASIMLASKYQSYQVENSYQGTVTNLQNGPFAVFTNVTYVPYKEDNPSHTIGFIKEISVNDSTSYTAGSYPVDSTKIKIYIYSN